MNQVVTQNQQAINLFECKKLDLLKNTICKGATDDEFELFLHACQRTGLDPFMRQIYSVKRWDSALRRETMTIQTGIDGYRSIAERTGKYCPGRESTYTYNESGELISSTSYVQKQTADGTWHEVAATAFFSEYCQKTKDGKPTRFWLQMGHTMLSKCAEALALRKSFPIDLSGLYTREEMQQADREIISQDSTEQFADAGKPKTINKEQWTELNQLIDQCDFDFQQKVNDFVASQEIRSFADMDEKTYEKIKKRCLLHIKTCQVEHATC